MEDTILAQVPAPLLAWYARSARALPWRDTPAPYRVWVSEIMLQQTRVEAVKPYFQRFMEALPSIGALAAAPEEQVLKLWEGLGYYSRARNLHQAAKKAVRQYGGLPATVPELLSLPGIGTYTAGAVASIAFGAQVPAVDGNVLRVVSRLLCREEDILSPAVKKLTERQLASILPAGRAGDFNQAMMELGALICLPGAAPKCAQCPLASICEAHRLGVEASLPVKSAKKPRRIEGRTVFVLTCRGRAALRMRPGKGLLAGLWELPNTEGCLDEAEARALLEGWGIHPGSLSALGEARHVFSHIEWHMSAWAAEAAHPAPGFFWATARQLRQEMTLPAAFKSYREELERRMCQTPLYSRHS